MIMSHVWSTIGIVLAVAAVVLALICAFRESKVVGTYKTLKVFGRLKAYLAFDFTAAGLYTLVMSIVGMFNPETSMGASASMIPVSIVCLLIGLLLFYTTYKKCPVALRKRVIWDMILVALGVSMKIGLFFFASVWAISTPDTYTDTNGNEYYVYADGEAYDPKTGRYGKITTNYDGTKAIAYYD